MNQVLHVGPDSSDAAMSWHTAGVRGNLAGYLANMSSMGFGTVAKGSRSRFVAHRRQQLLHRGERLLRRPATFQQEARDSHQIPTYIVGAIALRVGGAEMDALRAGRQEPLA